MEHAASDPPPLIQIHPSVLQDVLAPSGLSNRKEPNTNDVEPVTATVTVLRERKGEDSDRPNAAALVGTKYDASWVDPSWTSVQDCPDPSPRINPAPTFDFDACSAAWAKNKNWDEEDHEYTYPRQVLQTSLSDGRGMYLEIPDALT